MEVFTRNLFIVITMSKLALITGGAGNLGRAVVKKFYESGYRIVMSQEPGQKLDEAFLNDFPEVERHEVDVTHENDAERFVHHTIKTYERIDSAVLLVGGFAMGGIDDTNEDVLDKMIRLNFKSAYFIARPIFKQMLLQESGNLIFIGARPALEPKAGRLTVAYALSKSLLFRLAEMLNAEGQAKNVNSTVIVPSVIDTPVNRASMPTADFATWIKPEDLAETIYFVCSDTGMKWRETVLKVYNRA
jgi:NAD(P)-dependent dehydrogenase (short-subunit alcohol dehydrogenase family)